MVKENAQGQAEQNREPAARNRLTGLYPPSVFMEELRPFIQQAPAGEYCMIAVDILHFRLFNKFNGRETGNKLLRYIADCLKTRTEQYGGVAGYFEGDNFCIAMPWKKDMVEQLWEDIRAGVDLLGGAVGVIPAFGVSPIDNTELPPEIYYDRATLALSHVAGRNNIVTYDPGMEDGLEDEMRLLMEVNEALDRDEFTFYAQPQCDIFTGKVVGAESLVRWLHSTKGLIPPGRFVPAMERSGMIYLLDQRVWEKVFQWLRSWIDRGYHPIPISINISRIDVMSMDVPAYLTELLKKYDLPAKYIKTEITESAYTEGDKLVNDTVNRLRDAGFLVMMDDFGSGYSSLNMLKSIPVDVIKMDMRFLEISEDEGQKGIGILESIVNMARLMGLPIIVEGVENLQQENILRSLGCRYTQGYYYFKPMPVEQFERLMADERNLDFTGLHCKQVEEFHVRELMDGSLFTDTVLNNALGPCAIYDIYGDQIEITRVNEQAYSLAGLDAANNKDLSRRIWSNVRDDDRGTLLSLFEQAFQRQPTAAEGYIHYLRVDGKVLWVRVRVFFLQEKERHRIYFVSLSDLTALKQRRHEQAKLNLPTAEIGGAELKQLDQYYSSLPCGFGLSKVLLNKEGDPVDYDIVYINREMERMCGSDLNRIRSLILKAFGGNNMALLQKAYQAAFLGERPVHYAYSSISSHYLQLTLYQHEYGYVACLLRDVTHMQMYEGAFNSMVQSYREVYYLQFQDRYCRMIYPDEALLSERGDYAAMLERHFGTGKILKYDEENVRQFLSLEHLQEALQDQNSVSCRYRRSSKDSPDEWCQTTVTVNERDNGKPKTAVVTVQSIDHIIREEEEHRRKHMAETLASMSDAFFIYQATEGERLLYANPAVVELFGCQNMTELMELAGGSFQGLVHPEDLARVEWEIKDQIQDSDGAMDYVKYRIVRKDGTIRWVDDCGHLETSKLGEEQQLFYVFIKDITDSITTVEKNKLLTSNPFYAPK